jgi:hypothetical protein
MDRENPYINNRIIVRVYKLLLMVAAVVNGNGSATKKN